MTIVIMNYKSGHGMPLLSAKKCRGVDIIDNLSALQHQDGILLRKSVFKKRKNAAQPFAKVSKSPLKPALVQRNVILLRVAESAL